MKKEYIKLFMRNPKQNITLPFEVAEAVIDSKDQLVKILDKDGRWTGLTINKAEITGTDHDFDTEKSANYNKMQLAEPDYQPVDTDKFKPEFLKKQEVANKMRV